MLILSSPQLLGCDARPLGQGFQLGPGNLRLVDPGAEASISAGHDIVAPDQIGVAAKALGMGGGDPVQPMCHIIVLP